MSHHLSSDARGLILPCPACHTANRLSWASLGKQGRCGSCKNPLPAPAAPVAVEDPGTFSAMAAGLALPLVIDFWAPWCGPCRMMAPEFEKAAAMAAGEAVFAKVNTDEQPAIATQFQVQGIPAFALLKGGRVVARRAGFISAPQLVSWMRNT